MTDQAVRTEPQTIPVEIDRWNWGAFLLHWIWGLGNNTFIAFLVFIPFLGLLIMPFVLGAKGSVWAWRNGRWDSVAHFKRVQRLWAIWGVIFWLVIIGLFALMISGVFIFLNDSDAYRLGVTQLKASPEATSALGMPISTGMPVGSFSLKDRSGRAVLDFSASGPKASGHVFLEAIKKDGVWALRGLKLKIDGQDQLIDLLQQIKVQLNESRMATRCLSWGERTFLCSEVRI